MEERKAKNWIWKEKRIPPHTWNAGGHDGIKTNQSLFCLKNTLKICPLAINSFGLQRQTAVSQIELRYRKWMRSPIMGSVMNQFQWMPHPCITTVCCWPLAHVLNTVCNSILPGNSQHISCVCVCACACACVRVWVWLCLYGWCSEGGICIYCITSLLVVHDCLLLR